MKTSSLIDISKFISNDVTFSFYLNKKKKSCEYVANEIVNYTSLLAIPRQVHSSNIIEVNKSGIYNNVDGLITKTPGLLLSLQIADCVPIYLYALKTKIIGLIHAGWRGIVGGIVKESIKQMVCLGAEINDIKIYLGPSIGMCCYEVGDEVADNFDAKIKIDDYKWRIGIKEQIKFNFLQLGIKETNIILSEICTFESKEYHSYRRDGKESGRLISFAVLKK